MRHFKYNGKLYLEGTSIIGPDNRGLRYGDGLFETIKFQQGRLILLDEHLARLWKGMQLMQFQVPKLLTPDLIQQEILQLLEKNKHKNARVRLAVIRGNGGLYDVKNHAPNYIIESWALDEKNGLINENGLQLCIYPHAKKSMDLFSNLKHNNFLSYFMAALHAREVQCNDAIVLNSSNRVADTSIANIFLVKNKKIFTPALDEGCVAGVMRKSVIQQLLQADYDVSETAITTEMLLEADEVFLTNSIMNIRWVAAIADKKYTSSFIREIYAMLRQTNAAVFC